ncbi:MAG: LysR family transcriptional regulator [Rhodobiaceae bacterium]|nr:LysR family transcriptional regulator [Rhodobiaceae bacterium]
MDRFEEFETYVRVVEAGSLTAAAEQLGIAKSAVSRRLKDLETRLGAQLMTRTTRQITLTDSGKALYERALRLLTDWKETEAAIGSDTADLSGLIKVAAPLSFGVAHLGPAIMEFTDHHPNVQFDVDFNDRTIDLIAEGQDLAIRIGELRDSGLVARKLAPIKSVACASPDFIKRNGLPKTPRDLEAFQELRYSNRSDKAWHYTAPDGSQGTVKMSSTLAGTNGEFLRDAALAGRGILIEPCFIIHNELRDGSLVDLFPDYEWQSLAAYAVYPPTRHLSSRVRAFVDFLVERYKGTPYWEKY